NAQVNWHLVVGFRLVKGVGVLAGKKQLPPVQVVREGDEAHPASISAALGDRLNELRSVRRVMAAHLASENILARDLAALSTQFRDVSAEIEELEAVAAEAGVSAHGGVSSEDAEFRLEAI